MDGGQNTLAAGTDRPGQNGNEAAASDTLTAQDIKSWVHEILDLMLKVLPVVATLAAAYIANDYKASLTTSTLLSEREKADSQLRSEMFSKLVDPISGAKSDKGVPLEREQLLAELLSLNFHEHINLKPLLSHVDARLARASSGPSADKANEARAARHSFRAIAQAVISRQTAMLTRGDGESSKDGSAQLQKLDIGMPIPDDSALNEWMKPLFERMKSENVQPQVFSNAFGVKNPAQTHRLHLVVKLPNWDNETFQLEASIFSINSAGEDVKELAKRDLELSWFDFPLTDNTLLADGTRFSIVLDQVYDARERFNDHAQAQTGTDAVPRVIISIVWFPRDYIAARERPTNHREFRRSLGLDNR